MAFQGVQRRNGLLKQPVETTRVPTQRIAIRDNESAYLRKVINCLWNEYLAGNQTYGFGVDEGSVDVCLCCYLISRFELFFGEDRSISKYLSLSDLFEGLSSCRKNGKTSFFSFLSPFFAVAVAFEADFLCVSQ
jgi:hypothetical protein